MASLAAPDILKQLPISKFFEAMTVRLDPIKTAAVHLIVAFRITDTGRGYALEVRKGIAQLHESLPPKPDVTINLTLSDLQRIILRQTTFIDALKTGEIKAEGKQSELARFFGFFDPPATETPALTAR